MLAGKERPTGGVPERRDEANSVFDAQIAKRMLYLGSPEERKTTE